METIEINSIEGINNSIEIIIDGVKNPYPSTFYAIPQSGNRVLIKSERPISKDVLIVDLQNLKVNGQTFTSMSDAISAINELNVNFSSGGGSSSGASKPAVWGSIEGDLDDQSDLKSALDKIEGIAQGAKVSLVFDSKEQIDKWFDGTFTRPDGMTPGNLQTGWDLLNRTQSEPDYWWDGTALIENDAKVDLSEYYNKTEVDLLLNEKVSYSSTLNWYIDAVNGDDSNNGKTVETAKKTLDGLISYLQSVYNTPLNTTGPLTFYLADGDYSVSELNGSNIRIGSSGLTIRGISGNPDAVRIKCATWRGWSVLRIYKCTLFSESSLAFQGIGFMVWDSIVLGTQTWLYNTYLQLQVNLKLTKIGNTYGKILADGGCFVTTTSTCKLVIAQSVKTSHIFTAQNGGYFYLLFTAANVSVEDGTREDFTGIFMRLYDGSVAVSDSPKVLFPNCQIYSNYPSDATPDEFKKDSLNKTPLIEPAKFILNDSDVEGATVKEALNTLKTKELNHNDTLNRDAIDCHPIAAITGLEEELAKKVEDVPDSEILQTNKTTGSFGCATIGQDGKLYFAGSSGVCYLDDDSTIKPTNKTDGSFYNAAIGQDGKLYFVGQYGIYYLDNDHSIKPTNKTDGDFKCLALGQDGKLYFGSSGSKGIWYLDDDSTIKVTNNTNKTFYCAALGQDGKLYFGANGGIYYLDDDGTIKQTNQKTSNFACAALGKDGKLYFGNSDNKGIWYLDDDGTIKQTNKTDGYFSNSALGQDGKLYFGKNPNSGGIWYLDDDSTIKPTNKMDGISKCLAIGQDGKLYFGIGSNLWYLDNYGIVKQTNIEKSFVAACIGQDGKIYFCTTNTGIYYLESSSFIREDKEWKELTHDIISGRNKKDSHPISAITGLEERLDELGGLSSDHNDLEGRDNEDCHPIPAISGLEERLEQLQTLVETLEVSCVPSISTDKIFPQWDWGTGGTSITTPYTAPSNGWLQWYYDIPASQSITVKVNAVTVFSTSTSTSTAARPIFAVFPVRSGDVIDILQGSTTHLSAAFFAVPDTIEGTAECTVISAPDDAEMNMVHTAEYIELEKNINELRSDYEDLRLLQASKLDKVVEDGIAKMELNNDFVNAEHNGLEGTDEPDCHPVSAITGLSEKLSELDGKADDLHSLSDSKLNKGGNDDTARIVLNGAPADPQTQIEKILMNNPAGLGMGAGSGLGMGWSSDLLNLLLNDSTDLSKGVKTKLYVSIENRPEGTTSVSILDKVSGGFAVNTWTYFDASDNSAPVRIGYYNNAWYAVGSNGIPVNTYYLHKVYWIDSSQQFIQKKSWDAESMNKDMKLLGIESDNFRTVMLSDLLAKRFRVDGNSTSSPGVTLNLLNGLSINIQAGVVKVNSTKAVNMDIRRSGEYDNGSGHGGTSDGYALSANGTYTFATLTSSQLSSAATTDIYLRDNTNNVFYVLHYFISGSSARTTIWGEVVPSTNF